MDAHQVETSQFGSALERSLVMVGDALAYEHRFLDLKWERLGQLNDYQGMWINRDERLLCSYTEGDIVVTSSDDDETFQKEIAAFWDWYANDR